MNEKNNYHISFFRPTTQRAKTNRNTVLWLVSIWVIGIFGFHFLMRAIEKPTPEPELLAFKEVWTAVKENKASDAELQTFAQSVLHVTGKVFISTTDRNAIDNGISWAVFELADSAQKVAINSALVEFEDEAGKNLPVNDEAYVKAKLKLGALVSTVIDIPSSSVLASILPLELKSNLISEFTNENKTIVESCMPKYLIHNRSVLTDTKFLGFPFHYFYTAVFLLILFIGLCYAYCVRVDNYNRRMDIVE